MIVNDAAFVVALVLGFVYGWFVWLACRPDEPPRPLPAGRPLPRSTGRHRRGETPSPLPNWHWPTEPVPMIGARR